MPFLYSFCSSSKGNCTYIGSKTCGVLIDAGIGIRNFAAHLALVGISSDAIKGIFVTHEHSDHIKGLKRLQSALKVPVYASGKTLAVLAEKDAVNAQYGLLPIAEELELAGMKILPFRTSHDAVESQCYSVTFPDGKKIALCTDLGVVTPAIHEVLSGSDLVLLESNYEPELLRIGGYPPFLKRRIAGTSGHLSNLDAAEEICRLYDAGVRRFVLGHLSEENNLPTLALQQVVNSLAEKDAMIGQDYTLWVAPKTNHGKIEEV